MGQGPPEVVISARDKQPGEVDEGQQSDERKQYINPTKQYILTVCQSFQLVRQYLENYIYM